MDTFIYSIVLIPSIIALAIFVLSGLKVVNQYERGVRFTLGRYSGLMQPGLRIVIPILQSWRRIDIRTKVADVPEQDAVTNDNVTVQINAVLYYRVMDPKISVLEVENYDFATKQLALITMRNVVGQASLDELLSQRDKVSAKIQKIVDEATDPWGIKVEAVDLKDVQLPGNMVRVMAKEAEAERERKGVIIKAEGEVIAATNIAKAAAQLSKTPGALHLRTLHSVNDLSSDKSNTIIYAMPLEVMRLIQKMGSKR